MLYIVANRFFTDEVSGTVEVMAGASGIVTDPAGELDYYKVFINIMFKTGLREAGARPDTRGSFHRHRRTKNQPRGSSMKLGEYRKKHRIKNSIWVGLLAFLKLREDEDAERDIPEEALDEGFVKFTGRRPGKDGKAVREEPKHENPAGSKDSKADQGGKKAEAPKTGDNAEKNTGSTGKKK